MNSYSQHFKNIKKNKQKKMSLGYHSNKVKKENPLLQFLGLLSLIGFCLALYGFLYPENIAEMSNFKISFFAEGIAASDITAKKSQPTEVEAAEHAQKNPPSKAKAVNEMGGAVEKKPSHLEQLLDKEKELVEREKRLVELEAKLQQTQLEMDKKLLALEETRREIASKLETRVVQDQESINKLVDMYSNMKPQVAAGVISKLDEELAISVLRKMKKQDAGSILNFMDIQKAKVLSEKYSGY